LTPQRQQPDQGIRKYGRDPIGCVNRPRISYIRNAYSPVQQRPYLSNYQRHREKYKYQSSRSSKGKGGKGKGKRGAVGNGTGGQRKRRAIGAPGADFRGDLDDFFEDAIHYQGWSAFSGGPLLQCQLPRAVDQESGFFPGASNSDWFFARRRTRERMRRQRHRNLHPADLNERNNYRYNSRGDARRFGRFRPNQIQDAMTEVQCYYGAFAGNLVPREPESAQPSVSQVSAQPSVSSAPSISSFPSIMPSIATLAPTSAPTNATASPTQMPTTATATPTVATAGESKKWASSIELASVFGFY